MCLPSPAAIPSRSRKAGAPLRLGPVISVFASEHHGVMIERGSAEAGGVSRVDGLGLKPHLVDQKNEQTIGDLPAMRFPRRLERRGGDALRTQGAKIVTQ